MIQKTLVVTILNFCTILAGQIISIFPLPKIGEQHRAIVIILRNIQYMNDLEIQMSLTM